MSFYGFKEGPLLVGGKKINMFLLSPQDTALFQ